MKSLVIVYSYHHNNTEKIAKAMAEILEAKLSEPKDVNLAEIREYDLIGFGSGIYGAKHHKSIIDMAEKLPTVQDKKTFIFSTSAMMGKDKVAKDHETLRGILQSKGYFVIDEFACKGFNTNSFMKYLGGMNKGRPNAEDLQHAEEFARRLQGVGN